MTPMSVGSMFSGIGGIDAGLEACGLRTAWMCESDPFRQQVLRRRFPDVPIHPDAQDLGRGLACTVLAGGSPCQDLAAHGSRKGLEGERSGLWYAFLDAIELAGPEVVFFENVAAVLTSRKGLDFATILEGLAQVGLDAVWGVFRAAEAQLAHRRARLFLLAYTDEGRRALDRSTHHDHGGQPFGHNAHGCDAPLPAPPGPHDVAALQAWLTQHDGPQPGIRRDLAGIPDRVDRVAALGDTAPPALVALAWRTLRDLLR